MIIGLNLLYLLPGLVGGTETYAAGLIHGLSRSDTKHRFVVYLNRESAEWPLPADPRFRRVVCPVRAASRAARYRYEQFRLPSRVRTDAVDLLHSLGYVAPLRLNCPSVVTVHDVHHLAYGRLREWPRRVLLGLVVRHSARRAAAVIAVSHYSRDAVVRAYDLPSTAVDVVWSAPSPGLREKAAGVVDGHRPGPPTPYLVAFGGLAPNKNLDRLLQAFALARNRLGIPQRLVLVGHLPASLRPRMADNIFATGYLEEAELARVLGEADALVFPSLYEGFGLPVLEAMAAGVPVACSHAASLPEVAGSAALYFDPTDVEDIASQVARIASDQRLRSELRTKGLKQAASFTWERSARETLAIYDRVLRRSTAD